MFAAVESETPKVRRRMPNKSREMKALATKPADRYQTVPDLQKDIEAYQGGFATSAERAGAWKQIGVVPGTRFCREIQLPSA